MGSPVVPSVPNSQTWLGLLAAEPIVGSVEGPLMKASLVCLVASVPVACRSGA
jgi:hypothetical protein